MYLDRDNITFDTFWNEKKTEEVGELEAKFLGFDPCMKYEPLNTATLKRTRLRVKRDGTYKNINTYTV